jgi:hypothetical protein
MVREREGSEREGERESERERERVGKCEPKEERACVWVGEWRK